MTPGAGRRGIKDLLPAAIVIVLAVMAVPAAAADLLPGLLGKGLSTERIPADMPVTIEADTLSYDEETGIVLAQGNVVIVLGDRRLMADMMMYNTRTREADLSANVHYSVGGDEFSFDRVRINFDTEMGTLYNGRIRLSTNNYQIESGQFEKTGSRSFVLRKGSLTTCPCDPECDWKFDIGQTSLVLDGYAHARNVVFRIRGVPVLWLPYAIFPVKLTRQSGFLLPHYTKSTRKGFALQIPYYWAINRWSDATISLEAMSQRGLRPEVEYRFVLNSLSFAQVTGTYFYDTDMKDTRHRVDGTNIFRYGEEYTANAEWDLASDDTYYVDFVDNDVLRTARHVASRGFAGSRGDSWSQGISAVWAQDVQESPVDNTVQRLPEYAARVLPRALWSTRFEAGGEIRATYFYRKDGEDEFRGRALAEVSRTLILYPSVTVTPYAGADLLESGEAPLGDGRRGGRVVPTAGVAVQAEASRDFGRGAPGKFVHAVKGSAEFRWVPRVGQSDIPLTDQWSRLGPQDQLTLSLFQRLLSVVPEGGPRDVGYLELSWAFDADGREKSDSPYIDPLSPFVRGLRDQVDLGAGRPVDDKGSSDVYARFGVFPTGGWSVSGETLFNPSESRFTTAALGAGWERSKENRVRLEYRFSRDLAEDINLFALFRPIRALSLRLEADYSIRNAILTNGRVHLTMYPRSDCWSIGIGVSRKTNPSDTSFELTFSLKGIGSV